MKGSNQQNKDFSSIGGRLQLLAYILLLSVTVYIIVVFMGSALMDNYARLNHANIYVSVSSWDIPVFLGLPCFLALIAALLIRLLNFVTEKRIQVCIKIGLLFAALAILVRLPYGYIVSDYMEKRGYSPCWHYSSPSMMSSTVWVKSPSYCVKNAGKVRKNVLKWMDGLPHYGKDISVEEVREYVLLQLDIWQQEEIARLSD